jgi:hypothetical protein
MRRRDYADFGLLTALLVLVSICTSCGTPGFNAIHGSGTLTETEQLYVAPVKTVPTFDLA